MTTDHRQAPTWVDAWCVGLRGPPDGEILAEEQHPGGSLPMDHHPRLLVGREFNHPFAGPTKTRESLAPLHVVRPVRIRTQTGAPCGARVCAPTRSEGDRRGAHRPNDADAPSHRKNNAAARPNHDAYQWKSTRANSAAASRNVRKLTWSMAFTSCCSVRDVTEIAITELW